MWWSSLCVSYTPLGAKDFVEYYFQKPIIPCPTLKVLWPCLVLRPGQVPWEWSHPGLWGQRVVERFQQRAVFFSERNFTSGDWRFCSWSFSCLHTKGPLIWNRGRFIHLEVSRLAFYSPGACVPDKTGTGLRDISSHQGLVTPGRTDKMLVLSHVMLVEILTNICGAAILM